AGTGDEAVQCELGCNTAAPGGCNLCKPSQTACTNGTVATCDASGNVTSMRSCPLGCFKDQPRCTDIDPSNGLAPYLDMTTTVGVDLDLKDGSVIDTADGSVSDGKQTVKVPSFLVAAPTDGVPIRVFVVKSARIAHAVVSGSVTPAPAFA